MRYLLRCFPSCLRSRLRITWLVPSTYLGEIVKSHSSIIRTRKHELLNWLRRCLVLFGCSWVLQGIESYLRWSWTEELNHVNEFGMVSQLLNDFSSRQFPNYDLSVVSRADYIFVTVADDNPGYVVKVGVKWCLKSESITVPDLDDTKGVRFVERTYPSSAALTIKDPVWSN